MCGGVNTAQKHIKAHHKEYKIDISKLNENCLHINVIEAAIKKEGPSAGIALTSAILSLLLKKAISSDVAMTGEITLTGNILPIGGLKEKVTGAYSSGVRKIILPKDNEKDIEDIPKEVKDDIEFIIVSNYKEVYEYLFKSKK